jgi:hypothetical protein
MKYGCVMIPLPEDLSKEIRTMGLQIPDKYRKDSEYAVDGVPSDMHVTAKYGIIADVEEVAKVLVGVRPFMVTLGQPGVFHNTTEVVLRLLVEGKGLVTLHNKLCHELQHVNTYQGFKGHVTVAYLDKLDNDPYYYRKFFDDRLAGQTFEANSAIYSMPNGQKYKISFDGKIVQMKKERMEKIARKIFR